MITVRLVSQQQSAAALGPQISYSESECVF